MHFSIRPRLPAAYLLSLLLLSACPRRFYLRYLARVPWPEAPLGATQEEAYDRGHRFHRRVERHFLGLVADEEENDPVLRVWWDTFRRQGPPLPPGRRFVETGLTVPIGNHFLTGRFDLLIVGADESGQPAAHVFDWKTGDPRPLDRLRAAWQTRVYLAVLAQGGAALAPEMAEAFAPDRLSFTYWYAAHHADGRARHGHRHAVAQSHGDQDAAATGLPAHQLRRQRPGSPARPLHRPGDWRPLPGRLGGG